MARHGALAFELYRPGPDLRWGQPLPDAEHGPGTSHDLRSATKSVTGLLVGVAEGRGLLDLDSPMLDHFPEHADLRTPARARVRLRHLLTMSAGLAWDENRPMGDPEHGEVCLWRSPGRDVVPARYVADSVSPRIGAADRLFFYGHHWWLGRPLVGGREVAWAAAIGLGGQRLFVAPDLRLAAAVTADHYADAMQSWLPLVLLNRFVLGAVAGGEGTAR